MQFTEKHHAFLSASFYKKLKEKFSEKGIECFEIATIKYGEQRGARMAQRAIEDGMPLNFQTYLGYGEWSYSKSFLQQLEKPHIEIVTKSPDYNYNVRVCPWHDQYKSMNLIEGAKVYCKHLDKAISRGFNPYLTFNVPKTLHESDHCVFNLVEADLENKKINESPHKKLPFEYHCAHVYYTFSRIAKNAFQFDGLQVSFAVLNDFKKEYGIEFANKILKYEHIDFNFVYETD